ncbi:MAG TPA: hypothetical protein VFC19_43690 [Candidatus Limnocylindrales bacterium]|nr:hypothetical protein [Candidatus Limnocylindrales bacterium]
MKIIPEITGSELVEAPGRARRLRVPAATWQRRSEQRLDALRVTVAN